MLRLTLTLCALVAFASAFQMERNDMWTSYKLRHNKDHSGQRDVIRRGIWESNLDYIQGHNIEADRGLHTYWMGENQFTDLTNNEFRQMMNGYRMSNRSSSVQFVPTMMDPPTNVDWRTEGYVTPIKNQEQCGSCWAFSTTGSMEGQTFKKTKKLTSLSEQNLMDCSKKEGNQGCQGGLMDNAFKYIIKNKGIDTEESYPYTAKNGRKCEYKAENIGATETSFVDVKRASEPALAQAIAEIGPISVAMDASHMSFQHYRTGIYKERACSSIKLDHGVLAVGYGADSNDGSYWIVKNSWGTSWGDKGFFKLAKDDKNMCGLATQASYPVV